MAENGSKRAATMVTGLRYVKYRVKDIEKVVFPGQSHGLEQRCPDNQFLFFRQIGLILQELPDYIVDRDSDSMSPYVFSRCLLFNCQPVKKM